MLVKSEVREILEKVLGDHLEEDEVSDAAGDVLNKLSDLYPMIDDEEDDVDDEDHL